LASGLRLLASGLGEFGGDGVGGGLVGELEAGLVDVEDVGGGHDERGTGKVLGAGVEGGEAECGGEALHVGGEVQQLALRNDAEAVAGGGDGDEVDLEGSELLEGDGAEPGTGIVDMVDVEHSETGGDGACGFALVALETLSVGRDDGELALEAGEFVGIVAVEEFDLVADILDLIGCEERVELLDETGGAGGAFYAFSITESWEHGN